MSSSSSNSGISPSKAKELLKKLKNGTIDASTIKDKYGIVTDNVKDFLKVLASESSNGNNKSNSGSVINSLKNFLISNNKERLKRLVGFLKNPKTFIIGTLLAWIVAQIRDIVNGISEALFNAWANIKGIFSQTTGIIANDLLFIFSVPFDAIIGLITVYLNIVNGFTGQLGLLSFPVKLAIHGTFLVLVLEIMRRLFYIVLEFVGGIIQIDIADIIDRILGR